MADPTPQPQPAPEPTPAPAPEPTPAPEPEFKPVTSQEQFDRMTQDRIARERAKFGDYDELKKKAEEFDKLQDEQKTELEKERDRAAKAEERAQSLEQETRATALRAAIISEAAKAERKIADPEAAVAFLTGLDAELLEVDSDGKPTNVAKAMDSLLEKRPYLVVSQAGVRPGGADQGARQQPELTELEKLDDPAKVREAVAGLRK